MISKKIGIVTEIIKSTSDLDEIRVSINGEIQKAYNYRQLTGGISVEDNVVLNTTAVELSLGTGGYHFVISNLDNLESEMTEGGHIMKLRYTPYQIKVNAVEEQDSEYHSIINKFKSLNNLPVAVGTLHSMLVPFACTYKKNNPNKKLVYIMTDGASLPISLSMAVSELKDKGLVDNTITIGNSFGGDFECINIYTALITAKEILNADAVFVSMGPGIAGSGTKYGFTGIEQGHILDAVGNLGGSPIAIPRVSFGDKRDRHVGLSHHSETILDEIVNVKTNIIFNILDKDKENIIKRKIDSLNWEFKHDIHYIDYEDTLSDLNTYGMKVKTMGRGYNEDREFFDCASGTAFYIGKNY